MSRGETGVKVVEGDVVDTVLLNPDCVSELGELIVSSLRIIDVGVRQWSRPLLFERIVRLGGFRPKLVRTDSFKIMY